MQQSVASKLSRNIYMDDLQHEENLDAMIQEVDTGLKQANFVIKQWVKTGDSLKKQETFEQGKTEVLKKST